MLLLYYFEQKQQQQQQEKQQKEAIDVHIFNASKRDIDEVKPVLVVGR